jgi:hypothetical protein
MFLLVSPPSSGWVVEKNTFDPSSDAPSKYAFACTPASVSHAAQSSLDGSEIATVCALAVP